MIVGASPTVGTILFLDLPPNFAILSSMKQNKSFFGHLTYFATCEGLAYVVAHVLAASKEEAARKFIVQHLAGEWGSRPENVEDSIKFWSQGLDLVEMDGSEKSIAKVREMAQDLIDPKMIDHLVAAEKGGALFEFYFKSYVNYS